MMKNKKLLIFFLFFSFVFSSSAFAGKWIKGSGPTIGKALENATILAKRRIIKRLGHGCIDGKTRNLKRHFVNGKQVWTIELYTHNHNGSCGK